MNDQPCIPCNEKKAQKEPARQERLAKLKASLKTKPQVALERETPEGGEF